MHYSDITGEIDVLEACAARNAEATRAGITVMPGVGFDVVPSDCLAAHMKSRMPECRHLTLAISVLGGVSRGTSLTGIQSLGRGVRVRRDGAVVTLARPLWRDIDFGSGPEAAVAVGWGDVATAFYSTGIPDITVFFRAAGGMGFISRMETLVRPLSRRVMQGVLGGLVRLRKAGPTAAQRDAGRAVLIAEAEDGAGNILRSRLETPKAYALTVLTCLAVMERVMAGGIKPGFQTPSLAFGPDFVLEIPGTRRTDEET